MREAFAVSTELGAGCLGPSLEDSIPPELSQAPLAAAHVLGGGGVERRPLVFPGQVK